VSSALEHAPKPKTIRGVQFTAASTTGGRIAASQHINNAWTPRGEWAACANRTHNISLRPDRIRRQGFKGAIATEGAVAELAPAAWRYCWQSFAPHRAQVRSCRVFVFRMFAVARGVILLNLIAGLV
jgi:hypothetical protein